MTKIGKLELAIDKLAVNELAVLNFRAKENTGRKGYIDECGEREERT
jgi:hypothetical protein